MKYTLILTLPTQTKQQHCIVLLVNPHSAHLINYNAVYGTQSCMSKQLFKELCQKLHNMKTKQTRQRSWEINNHAVLFTRAAASCLWALCQLSETGQITVLSNPLSSLFLTADTFWKPHLAFSPPNKTLQMRAALTPWPLKPFLPSWMVTNSPESRLWRSVSQMMRPAYERRSSCNESIHGGRI